VGWVADRFAADNPRPVWLFALLTVFSLAFGLTTWTSSVMLAMLLISWGAFIGGGFQMVALKVGSYAFPREQAAMMSGIAFRIVCTGRMRCFHQDSAGCSTSNSML